MADRRVILGGGALALFALFGGAWAFGREPLPDLGPAFFDKDLPADVEAWLQARELSFPDIRPGAQAQIAWAGAPGRVTPWSVVYLHGFSATHREIAPVPQRVAQALGANLFLARLTGHGADGAALGRATAGDWLRDLDIALAIGRRIGGRVLVIATSTGATLALLAAADPVRAAGLAGLALISPNLALASPAAVLLDLPLARHWGPWLAGRQRGFAPVNADHARWWTTDYPTAALFPMAAVMRAGRAVDPARARVPALFVINPADRVVDTGRIPDLAARWAAGADLARLTPGPGDDPHGHVLGGDILSPGLTGPVTDRILAFAGAR